MKVLKTLIKLVMAAGIIWLIWDKVDPEQFQFVFSKPLLLLLIPACWLLNQLLTTMRLHAILRALGRPTQLYDVLRANMSSLFLGNLMPGVVGADVVKFFYLRQHDPNISKMQLLLILALDRMLGLIAILFWCTVFSFVIMKNSTIYTSEASKILIYLPVVLLFTAVVGLILVDVCMKYLLKFKLPNLVQNLVKTYHQLIHTDKKQVLLLIMAYNLLAVFILLLGLVFVGAQLQLQESGQTFFALQFFLIPLALIASILPLTPMGIGVAQITLASAYELFGLAPSVGFSVTTFSQFGLIVVSVFLGGLFFVFSRKPATYATS